ncbi:GntR family transcriptional regulator [Streptomyces sp. NPDC126514]|uniref:GntR family transcriptional regulator n=1 Tax=Streptomyces sp. NPDC126514 TaxID=3155210 RepID=UPI0033192B63
MPQASPRDTYLQIAEVVKAQIKSNPQMTHLPPAADLMRNHDVSRGVVLRAFKALQKDGVAQPVRGGRWRVAREGEHVDQRPLDERIADLIPTEGFKVGETFLSASDLMGRFGVSRPTVTKALDKLEAAGVLASAGQGKVRTVRAVPNREERS